MSLSPRILFFSSVIALASFADGSTAGNHFQTGIKAYEQGDYETAQAEFTIAVNIDETPAARHNLGLAELRLNRPAEAAWQLERALLLDPFKRDYREKLELVRKQLGLNGNPGNWYYSFSQLLPINIWLMIASISFWLLFAAFVLPGSSNKKTGVRVRLLPLFSLLVLILSLAAIRQNAKILKRGIVLSEEPTSLHAAPATAAPDSGFARPGERAQVLDRHNDFYQVKTEGAAKGWIAKDVFRLLLN